GFAPGDVVCLLMKNCPQYLAIWLGLSRIGATVALINTNLTGEPLAHALGIVAPRHVIVGAELSGALAAVRSRLAAGVGCSAHGPGAHDLPRLDLEVGALPGEPLRPAERAPPALADRALYIYTSGTTGLPKAANVSHLRLMQWSEWFAGLIDVQPHDRLYNCLPMYHSVGGVVACGAALVGGAAVVVRERFSVSRFWQDVAAERCTLFQYIGELCRYLSTRRLRPRRASTYCASPAATACAGKSGGNSSSAFASRRSSSITPRPKATSRSTTARVARGRSGGSRPFSRTACRSRSCASTSR